MRESCAQQSNAKERQWLLPQPPPPPLLLRLLLNDIINFSCVLLLFRFDDQEFTELSSPICGHTHCSGQNFSVCFVCLSAFPGRNYSVLALARSQMVEVFVHCVSNTFGQLKQKRNRHRRIPYTHVANERKKIKNKTKRRNREQFHAIDMDFMWATMCSNRFHGTFFPFLLIFFQQFFSLFFSLRAVQFQRFHKSINFMVRAQLS